MSSGAVSPPSASDLTPSADLVARFRGDLEALTGEPPSPDRRLGVAVSGGADSLALLLLAAAAYPGAVEAATVNHGLRPEAADEAAFVEEVCARLGVRHDTLALPQGFVFEGNLQEQARLARYTTLALWAGCATLLHKGRWRAEWVATAHQRDDVAEGFLMRARRGAGLAGLAAMRAARPIRPTRKGPAMLVRPLLGWSRSELEAVTLASGLSPVCDPSNVQPRFDRSRIRQLIADTPDLPADRLALAATNLRHAEDALDWLVKREWTARSEVEDHETIWLDMADLPYELRRRLVRRAIEYLHFEINAPAWRGTGLDRFVQALDRGQAATLAEIAGRPGRRWRFRPAPPRRSN